MAATIGGTSCTYVHGTVPDMMEAVEVWDRPGIDGHGARTLGLRGTPFTLRAVKLDTEGNVNTWRNALVAKAATVVSITDDHNESHANCLILRLGTPQKTFARHAGVNKKRCEIAVHCLRVGS